MLTVIEIDRDHDMAYILAAPRVARSAGEASRGQSG